MITQATKIMVVLLLFTEALVSASGYMPWNWEMWKKRKHTNDQKIRNQKNKLYKPPKNRTTKRIETEKSILEKLKDFGRKVFKKRQESNDIIGTSADNPQKHEQFDNSNAKDHDNILAKKNRINPLHENAKQQGDLKLKTELKALEFPMKKDDASPLILSLREEPRNDSLYYDALSEFDNDSIVDYDSKHPYKRMDQEYYDMQDNYFYIPKSCLENTCEDKKNQSFYPAFPESSSPASLLGNGSQDAIGEVPVEEKINPQKLVGVWKRHVPTRAAQKKYKRMITDVLDVDTIKYWSVLKPVKYWYGIPDEDIGDLAKEYAARLDITIKITEDGDSLLVKPFSVQVPGFPIADYLALGYAKYKNLFSDVWSSKLNEVSVAAVNGPTKLVCGFKYTSTGVEFGFLQCYNELEIAMCSQYVEMQYSLKENGVLEQHFTVYYLQRSITAKFVKPGEECPNILESQYVPVLNEDTSSFTLQWYKQKNL